MTYVRIFLASSINEFSEERNELKDFARRITDKLIDRGIYIRLFICEYTDNAIAYEIKQEEYNREIDRSDIFLLLSGRQIGEYTLEEYERALISRCNNGRPLFIIVAQKKDKLTASLPDELIIQDDVTLISFDSTDELKDLLTSIIDGIT